MTGNSLKFHFSLDKVVIDELHNRGIQELTILAGDIGHTKTLLGLFKLLPDGWHTIHTRIYESKAITSFEETLKDFLDQQSSEISMASFGVAGPIIEGRCQPTNLDWAINVASLRSLLKTSHVTLINDLVALGYSLDWLPSQDFVTIQKGKKRDGNQVVLAAGTGLGECTLFWDGNFHHPSPSEGGHSDFAPQNDWEIGLLQFLSRRYPGHVSVMRVVSGHGINNLFDYAVSKGVSPATELLKAQKLLRDIAPAIARAGIEGSCPASVEVMKHFPRLYGAEAGNLALKNLAIGGVYLGGGIAPEILNFLTDGRFLDGFLSKGRFRWLLEEIPVHVILQPKAHVLGAIRHGVKNPSPQ